MRSFKFLNEQGMKPTDKKHWSKIEYLHQSVKNPNIHIKGKHSYYSDAWTGSFEETVVRYLYGDEYSLKPGCHNGRLINYILVIMFVLLLK